LGKAERTENEPHFEELATKTDKTKTYTEKLVKNAEAVLVPNPAARLEAFMFDRVQPLDQMGSSMGLPMGLPTAVVGKKEDRLSNLEYLGSDMIEAGNEFGSASPYGE